MLKRLTLLASSLLAALSIAAQETTTATASFAVEDGGKTLVVYGKGDLTTLLMTATELSFTADGLSNVKTTNSEWGTAATNPYNSETTYYSKHYVATQVEVSHLNNATATYSWTEQGLALYYTSDNGSTWTQVTNESTVDIEGQWNNNKEYSKYSTTDKSSDRILLADFKSGGYFTTSISGENVKFNGNASNYYQKTAEGYTAMTEGSAYDNNTTYYKKVFGSVTEAEMVELNYLEYATGSFLEFLNAKILDGATIVSGSVTNTFETVRFKNIDNNSTLLINDDIVQAILFPTVYWSKDVITPEKNKSIETLDLGEATMENLTSDAFIYKSNNNQLANMTSLTLPLTKMTSVYSESEKAYVQKMVLPSQVLNNYSKYTPGEGSANLVTVTIPEGYDRLADKALYGNDKITTFNLPSTLKLIGNSAFENCVALASITLNDGLENIGKHAFVGTALTKINFPSTLRIINDAAFANLRIEDLKFNAGLYYIGNTAFGLNYAIPRLKSIQIPASVKFIGACAFYGREYQDVYFLGENAPIMPMGGSVVINDAAKTNTAFPANTLNGNNGFHPGTEGQMPTADNMMDDANSGYANRENYKNQGYYFAILHFPTGLTDAQREKYTDITRIYKTGRNADGSFTYDASGGYVVGLEETDGHKFGTCTAYKKVAYGYEDTYLGKQYIWPSQSQWNRSYVVNSEGYNWDGVTKYRPTLSDEDKEILKYAGYEIGEGAGQYTEDELQKIAHMGTRQFVLTNADTQKDEKPEEEPEYPVSVEGSNWWTICLPFNMTKKQVDEVFGTGTHVCRFSSVSRTDDGKGNKSITLRFQNDVYATKWTRDAKTLAYTKNEGVIPAVDDVVIYSHEAYMIFPKKSKEDAIKLVRKDYTFDPGSPLPTIIKANANDNSEGADHTEYRFVGNYVTQVSVDKKTSADEGVETAAYKTVTIPQYSYVYAKKKSETAYKFWFYTGTASGWAANKCVVQATARDGGTKDFNNFFGGNGNSTKVTQMSLFGEETDGETTGVNEEITIIAGEGDNAQRIYNLNGQMIGTSNVSASHKGIYIKDGKKYIRR